MNTAKLRLVFSLISAAAASTATAITPDFALEPIELAIDFEIKPIDLELKELNSDQSIVLSSQTTHAPLNLDLNDRPDTTQESTQAPEPAHETGAQHDLQHAETEHIEGQDEAAQPAESIAQGELAAHTTGTTLQYR